MFRRILHRIKAIYIIPVALVLLLGVAYGGYSSLFTPAMKKVTDARKAWEDAKKASDDAESGYQGSIDDQGKYAHQIIEGHTRFKYIQDTMPNIPNFTEKYNGKDNEALREIYRILGTGEWITTMNQWVKTFHMPNTPKFDFSKELKDKTLSFSYKDMVPATMKLVEVDFPDMHFEAKGYTALLNQIASVTGYGYFPMIIDSKDGTYNIEVTKRKGWSGDPRKDWKHDPKMPLLKTNDFTCKAYFFTKDWDPCADVKGVIEKAQAVIDHPATVKPKRKGFDSDCPPVLWIFPMQAQGVTP